MTVKVTIADCRAGDEPKVFGGEGKGTVARLSVASNDVVKDAAGHDIKETTWMPVVAYGVAARFLAEHVHKGAKLEVEGELRNRTFEQEGQKHTVTEVHVIPGRGKISLQEAAGERQRQASDPQHNQF
jgi:single-strand DNA-binding protein